MSVRPSTRLATILHELTNGPRENNALCDATDEIGPYMARTMSKLIHRGLVVNLRPGKGHRALYALSSEPQP